MTKNEQAYRKSQEIMQKESFLLRNLTKYDNFAAKTTRYEKI